MYGVEWQQPAMVAMGLAQAAVHQDDMKDWLIAAEEAAMASSTPMPKIASLLQEVAANEKLSKAAHLSDDNKVRDGVLARAFDDFMKVASKVKVKPEELEERTIEMYHASVYMAAAAAIRPGKEARFDFFLMCVFPCLSDTHDFGYYLLTQTDTIFRSHHVNVCPLFLAINAQDWIPTASKVRLLEWKIRFDLVQYAARASAPLSVEKITSYVPKGKTLKPVSGKPKRS
jgi:hypothetical protein